MADRILYPNHEVSSYLDLIEENCIKFKRPKEEIEDIRLAVEELADNLLTEMGKHEPLFGNLKLLKVGSFYSEAKLYEPDEFDYLVVLDELPADQVKLRTICSQFPGFRHVFFRRDSMLATKWKHYLNRDNALVNRGQQNPKLVKEVGDWYREGRFRRTQIGEGLIAYEEGIRGSFHMCLCTSFHSLKHLSKISKQTGYLDLSSYDERVEFSANRYNSKVQRTEIQIHGPATNILVNRVPKRNPSDMLTITVDISPAFRTSYITGAIQIDDIEHEAVCKGILEQRNFLIVPTAYKCSEGLCFNIAHTETELRLTINLSDVHKRTYKLLKFIMNGGQKSSHHKPSEASQQWKAYTYIHNEYGTHAFECFSSFVLKTLIIRHSNDCKDGSGPAVCVMDVLLRIRTEILAALKNDNKSFVNIPLTNIFDRRQRIIPQKVHRDSLQMNLIALDDVVKILREGPFDLHMLRPVNIGSLLKYINSVDFSSPFWKQKVRHDCEKAYEILMLPSADTESPQ